MQTTPGVFAGKIHHEGQFDRQIYLVLLDIGCTDLNFGFCVTGDIFLAMFLLHLLLRYSIDLGIFELQVNHGRWRLGRFFARAIFSLQCLAKGVAVQFQFKVYTFGIGQLDNLFLPFFLLFSLNF